MANVKFDGLSRATIYYAISASISVLWMDFFWQWLSELCNYRGGWKIAFSFLQMG